MQLQILIATTVMEGGVFIAILIQLLYFVCVCVTFFSFFKKKSQPYRVKFGINVDIWKVSLIIILTFLFHLMIQKNPNLSPS